VAWFWNAVNSAMLSQLDEIPPEAWRIVKLEELDHEAYRDLVAFLGRGATLSRRRFDAVAAARPNALRDVATVADWSAREADEFEGEVEPMAARLGYEHRVERLLPLETDRQKEPSRGGRLVARRVLSRAMRRLARGLREVSRRLDPELDE
jgi:hypothetical protein